MPNGNQPCPGSHGSTFGCGTLFDPTGGVSFPSPILAAIPVGVSYDEHTRISPNERPPDVSYRYASTVHIVPVCERKRFSAVIQHPLYRYQVSRITSHQMLYHRYLRFSFIAKLVEGCILSGLQNKPRSQVSSPLPGTRKKKYHGKPVCTWY